ncbi:MAG: LytTR family DNA-binding domain-containing protein [Gammaproteobacteria bacterium]|nr:LytTR family DNA-binding domain-containing protein [Gammaproteobacteria bacterium]
MRILIVDDEKLARDRLRGQLGDLAVGEVVGEASNGVEAIERVQALQPDLVLLDIRMPRMDGLEVARHLAALECPPAVIFTTAYDDHALAAFDARAVDYVVKPIRSERLGQALERVRELARPIDHGAGAAAVDALPSDRARTHISAYDKGQLRIVPVSEVICFQAEEKYIAVRTATDQVLIEESLKALEEEFGERFVRVHRNALVALAHVDALVKEGAATYVLMKQTGERLAVSRRMVPAVRKRLRQVAV